MVNEDNKQPELPLGDRFIKCPIIGRLLKSLTWWLIFTGIYASSSVCPFCGRAGCAVGGISAGVVGAVFALVMARGKAFLNQLTGLLALIRLKLRTKPKA